MHQSSRSSIRTVSLNGTVNTGLAFLVGDLEGADLPVPDQREAISRDHLPRHKACSRRVHVSQR